MKQIIIWIYLKRQCDELDKKIANLQEMDEKTKKKTEDQKAYNDTIKEAIDTKKDRKKEEDYQKKTLEKQVNKLSKDIFIVQKE